MKEIKPSLIFRVKCNFCGRSFQEITMGNGPGFLEHDIKDFLARVTLKHGNGLMEEPCPQRQGAKIEDYTTTYQECVSPFRIRSLEVK